MSSEVPIPQQQQPPQSPSITQTVISQPVQTVQQPTLQQQQPAISTQQQSFYLSKDYPLDENKQDLIKFLDGINKDEVLPQNETSAFLRDTDYEQVLNEQSREDRRRYKKFNWGQGALSMGGIYFGTKIIREKRQQAYQITARGQIRNGLKKGFGFALIAMNMWWLKDNLGY